MEPLHPVGIPPPTSSNYKWIHQWGFSGQKVADRWKFGVSNWGSTFLPICLCHCSISKHGALLEPHPPSSCHFFISKHHGLLEVPLYILKLLVYFVLEIVCGSFPLSDYNILLQISYQA